MHKRNRTYSLSQIRKTRWEIDYKDNNLKTHNRIVSRVPVLNTPKPVLENSGDFVDKGCCWWAYAMQSKFAGNDFVRRSINLRLLCTFHPDHCLPLLSVKHTKGCPQRAECSWPSGSSAACQAPAS